MPTRTAPKRGKAGRRHKSKGGSGSKKAATRYQCREVLGQGAFATVWLARDQTSGAEVAIKVIEKASHVAAGKFEHFIAKSLSHGNVVRALSCVQTRDGRLILVQEYLPGGELFACIDTDYGVAEADGKAWLSDVVEALAYMHGCGIVHRDVKPENILLTLDGTAKLADFGMAEFEGQFTKTGPGTVPYMPPEALSGAGGYTVAASYDVWSLGVVLYVLLTGDFPWLKATGDDPDYAAHLDGSLQVSYPWCTFAPRMRELLARMLAVDPAQRCSVADVRPYLDGDWFVPANAMAASVASAAASGNVAPASTFCDLRNLVLVGANPARDGTGSGKKKGHKRPSSRAQSLCPSDSGIESGDDALAAAAAASPSSLAQTM